MSKKNKEKPELQEPKSNNTLMYCVIAAFAVFAAIPFTFSFDDEKPKRTFQKSANILDEPTSDNFKQYSEEVEKALAQFPPNLHNFLRTFLDSVLLRRLVACKTLEEAVIILNEDVPNFKEKLNLYLNRALTHIHTGTFDGKSFAELDIKDKLQAIGNVLVSDMKVNYKDKEGNLPYSLNHLINTTNGNCSTLPLVYAMVAHRLNLPVKLVTIGEHQLCRLHTANHRINIETTNPNGMGIGKPDSFYLKRWPTPKLDMTYGTTLKSLTLKESISAMYVTKMAYLAKIAKKDKQYDLLPAIAMSFYFNPRSSYAAQNLYNIMKNRKDWGIEWGDKQALLGELRVNMKKIGYLDKDFEGKRLGLLFKNLEHGVTVGEPMARELLKFPKDSGFKLQMQFSLDYDRETMKEAEKFERSADKTQYRNKRMREKNDLLKKMRNRRNSLLSQRMSLSIKLNKIYYSNAEIIEILERDRRMLPKSFIDKLQELKIRNKKLYLF